MKNIIYSLFIILTYGCVSNSEIQKLTNQIDSLSSEITKLQSENDNLKNGENRLIGLIEYSISNNKYIDAQTFITQLHISHPESDKLNKYLKLLPDITVKANAIKDSIYKAKQDSIARANINELGIWRIGNYIDDFDEPTGEHFVYTLIRGQFSNSATSNSELSVKMIFRKGYYDNLEVYVEYDEYANGVVDGAGWGDWDWSKIVCKERKILYKPRWGGKWENQLKEEIKVIDALLLDDILECKIYNREERTWYYFTIDTHYLKNALIKAQLISL